MKNMRQTEPAAAKNERSSTRTKKGRLAKRSILTACSLILGLSTVWSAHTYAADAAKRIYEYDADGRLTTIYSRDEKVTLSYDDNGNMISKSVEKGDYRSNIGEKEPVVETPVQPPVTKPEPTPQPVPTPTPQPQPDPTVTPPPVSVPAKQGLGLLSIIDTPIQYPEEPFFVSGWYLDPVGIQKVQVYADGSFLGNAIMGISREDVYNVYPDYNNHVSGYQLSVKDAIKTTGTPHKKRNKKTGKNEVVPGQFDHEIAVTFTNRNNQQSTITKQIVLNH